MSTIHDSDIRSGPDRYVSERGVAGRLGEYLQAYRNPVIVTGRRSSAAYLRHTKLRRFPAPALYYDGSATLRNAEELAAQAADAGAIVGIGGGKLSDTVKNIADILGVPCVIVPTLAATCAAYSALSVNYDEQHRYVNAPMHTHNSDLVIVDAGLVATGPIEYLIGGIGDTLAKWYESAPVFERTGSLGAFDRLAQGSAGLIRSILLEDSVPALASFRAGHVDEHALRVVDAIIGLGGTVGGFGGVRARASGAHAMHDALTLLPESTAIVHGAKVAYGIIVQLLAEGQEEEARRLLPFYKSVGLPRSFADMRLDASTENFRIVARFAAGPHSSFSRALPDVTTPLIEQAMTRAENLCTLSL
ncbi:MAG: iron-containing alcohol dehydrogenase family protein [Bifidobacterium psychraerophilum]|uniref:iron-containing alcohol dehydrogenase family protein n=1 Tax=Bifidobacterium psychraerophilum TaxID=218140 RepID=UPI0039EBCBE0